ncbi:MAG: sugar phosphate isomerase/epimerase [Candidatus Latescibacterota bacterium]|nr:sugar phosphate isomerase/epimerase [Candidatus Latescibacterota bacterium]
MKIALQEGLLPGDELAQKLDFAEELGIEGLEVPGRDLADRVDGYDRALEGRGIRLVSICGQSTFDWLDPNRDKREASIAETRRNIEIAGYFGAVGAIVPPIFGPPRIPDLSPYKDAITLEKKLLSEIIKDLGPYASEKRTLLLLEPLNRYEQHLLRRQADGVESIRAANDPLGAALICDFFHMHIEETSTPDTLRACGKRYVAHVHIADNTRMQPGTGDIDWKAGLQALKDIGFGGYLAYECGIDGDRPQALRTSVEFLRGVIDELS